MANNKPSLIPNSLRNPSSKFPYVAESVDIYDKNSGKSQEQINDFLEELKEADVFKDRVSYTRLKQKIERAASKANLTITDELVKELDDEFKNCGAYV